GDWDNNPAANHVWLNRMPASFQPILLSRTEQSGAACLADVDRDGDLDLLLGPKIWLQK
ncbi:MAG: FG-GAP-like repeat-containing protein, partial [Planctomycetota bacterium]